MNMSSYSCCASKSNQHREVGKIAGLLKVVTEESRLKILCILRNGEHCVCELIDHLCLSQSLVSHHLIDLKTAGIVVDDKRGQYVYYSLTQKGKQITDTIFSLSEGAI